MNVVASSAASSAGGVWMTEYQNSALPTAPGRARRNEAIVSTRNSSRGDRPRAMRIISADTSTPVTRFPVWARCAAIRPGPQPRSTIVSLPASRQSCPNRSTTHRSVGSAEMWSANRAVYFSATAS